MKPDRIWIVIADASRAHILENSGRGTGAQAVQGRSFRHASDPSHELGRDRPSRTHESSGPSRHAIEPKSDPHEKQKLDFARMLATELANAHAASLFDHLVLVAPHPFLGALREALPKQVAMRVKSEIAKDLTKTPAADLASHLGNAVPL